MSLMFFLGGLGITTYKPLLLKFRLTDVGCQYTVGPTIGLRGPYKWPKIPWGFTGGEQNAS